MKTPNSNEKEFENWYDEYFCDQQGEDSPYSYNDIKIAFLKGWKQATLQAEQDCRKKFEKIKQKILLDWKGQNECVDFINKIQGEKLVPQDKKEVGTTEKEIKK